MMRRDLETEVEIIWDILFRQATLHLETAQQRSTLNANDGIGGISWELNGMGFIQLPVNRRIKDGSAAVPSCFLLVNKAS